MFAQDPSFKIPTASARADRPTDATAKKSKSPQPPPPPELGLVGEVKLPPPPPRPGNPSSPTGSTDGYAPRNPIDQAKSDVALGLGLLGLGLGIMWWRSTGSR